ncbi:MAG: hypothetical protein U0031_14490 [Thermomicrobiales bacterium]
MSEQKIERELTEQDNQPDPTERSGRSATVGTGSMLGIGCIVTVLLLIVIAIAVRAFTTFW